VLSEAEYQAALAESPNVGRLQKKVDESIKKVEVMANLSSARSAPPAAAPGGERGQEGAGEPGPAAQPGQAGQPAPPAAPPEPGAPKESPAPGSGSAPAPANGAAPGTNP
jgi:monofunctional glycosyltransferase